MNEIEEYKLKYKPSHIVICVKGKDTKMDELSLIAISKSTNKVIALGNEAERLAETEAANDDVAIFSPLRYGFIAEYSYAVPMFKYFIQKSFGKSFRKPKVIVCAPPEPTEVELRAYSDLMLQCGARDVLFTQESAERMAEGSPDEYKLIIGISTEINKYGS